MIAKCAHSSAERPSVVFVQALPSGDLEMLLQQHPMMSSGMGRAPSFGMAKLESMELPDAVAAVVRTPSCSPCFPACPVLRLWELILGPF